MTEAELMPEETRQLSIWGVLGKRRVALWRWGAALAIAALAWLGGLAFLAPFRRNQVWDMVSPLGEPEIVYLACLCAAAALMILALLARQTGLAALAAAATAYLGAFWLSGWLYRAIDPEFEIPFEGTDDALGFALARLWFALPAALTMGAAALIFRGEPRPHLGFGDLRIEARDVSGKEKLLPYWRRLGGFAIFALVLGVSMQATAGFEPVTSGRLLGLAPAVLIAAIVNATAEEIVYRGFMQPAFMRLLGVGAGMWVAGLFFGVIHWGLSVGVLAALPVSLLIGVGAVVWGKAAYETRGLGWPIGAHALIDIAIMSVYFV